ncbi:MAG: hypothetical protein JWP01_3101 [Myxococcales bacterium]|nr:hypothetical protein [Myxococcales bacterium]
MKTITLALLVLASCTSSDPISAVVEHRETAVACPATAGNMNGADQCLVDADCGTDQACACAGTTFEHGLETRNLCVSAGCKIDADCGNGGLCSPSVGSCGNAFFGIQSFECRTAEDTCGADVDCERDGEIGACSFLPQVGHWACTFTQCAG